MREATREETTQTGKKGPYRGLSVSQRSREGTTMATLADLTEAISVAMRQGKEPVRGLMRTTHKRATVMTMTWT